jgi:uncharacterized caspase-like protein
MSARALLFAMALCGGCLIGSEAARSENRIALVIGNSQYQSVSVLPNPANDAKAMTDLLNSAQFEVITAANLTQTDMRQIIRYFAERVAEKGPDTVALVFYAGHGVQIDGENFLVPVDAKINRESDVAIEALRFDDLMNMLESVPSKARIVILDACRNNPFAELKKTTGRGLAIVNAPVGSAVAYSTSPGAEAEDGSGSNSPFTTAFIAAAREQGVPVEQTLRKVRLDVHKTTSGRQTPWEVLSLTSDFVFFPGGAAATPAAKEKPAAKTAAAWTDELKSRPAAEAFEVVIRDDSVEAYVAFLEVFPSTPFAPRVRGLLNRRVEMVAWYNAVTLNTVAAYQAFLANFPNSDLAATARKMMERARARSALASANPGTPGVPQGSPTAPRSVAPGSPQAAATPGAVPTPVSLPGPACTCEKPQQKASKPKPQKTAKKPPPRGPGRTPTDADIFGPGGGPPPSSGPPVSIGIGVGIPLGGRSRPQGHGH